MASTWAVRRFLRVFFACFPGGDISPLRPAISSLPDFGLPVLTALVREARFLLLAAMVIPLPVHPALARSHGIHATLRQSPPKP